MNLKNLLSKSISELKKAGIPNSELDARVLLENAIKKDSAFVFFHPEFLVAEKKYLKFRRDIKRRKTGEPLAYILGRKEFFGLEFLVNKNVLVPRPETEWLVEKGIEFMKKRSSANILDVGTGSGCIVISMIKNLPSANVRFFAVDNSKKAIAIAKKNSKTHEVEKYVHFYISDLLKNKRLPAKFDLIVANLPYVPYSKSGKATKNSISFEPKTAIFAEDNGTAIIKKFLIDAKDRISAGGMILLEADCRNAKKIFEFAKKNYSKAKIELKKDLAGLERYIVIKK